MERIPPIVRAQKRIPAFVKGTFGRLKPGANAGTKYQDLLWTSLTALKTSSDAFPPLKGVVGAAVSIMEISQRITHSKKDAHELAKRAVELLELLADVISDRGSIPDQMLASIVRFESILEEIRTEMTQLMNRGRMWRFSHLNRSESTLRKFNRRLDIASQDFVMASVVRTEMCVHQVQTQVTVAGSNKRDGEISTLRRLVLIQTVVFLYIPRLAV
ncbi:hypothetical protein DFH06DRAFT_1468495 [Mycena polygramma]|nr:hypothetical protein DFH06DRAFT_1468495 [Mycena polygramma]